MSRTDDLDNTRKYIRLFQMQLHGVLEDMASPAETLSSHFSDVLIKLHDLQDQIAGQDHADQEMLDTKMNNVIQELFQCVTTMQFLDAKHQRIENIADGLSYLIELNDCETTMKKDWVEINQMIIDKYKMDSERKIYQTYLQENPSNNDISLVGESNKP